jgi:hypothetical protein
MTRLTRGLVLITVLCGFASPAAATAHYVYHEASGNGAGGSCGVFRDNLAPDANDAVVVQFRVEYVGYTNQVRLYYTTDGSTPSGAFGTPNGTTIAVTASYTCTYDNGFGQVVDVATATIPAQPAGTTVRYIVSAWHSGGGDEIFANSGDCTTSACATSFSYTVLDPARVDLLAFAATRTAGGIALSWETGAEDACGAFSLRRCDRTAGACAFVSDHAGLPGAVIPCADRPAGARYAWLDASAVAGRAYSYYLRKHQTTGGARDYGPALVTDGDAPAATPPAAAPPPAPAVDDDAAPRASGCRVGVGPAGALAPFLVTLLVLWRRSARRGKRP